MRTQAPRLSILELRSVRGTGGGPEKTILLGAARHDRTRFDITVCYLRDQRDEAFPVRARAQELPIDYVELVERGGLDRQVWAKVAALVRERAIDVIHAHDYKTDAMALWLARRHGVTPVATAHGWTGQTARERYLYYPVDKRILTRFPRVIAVSGEIGDELIRRGLSPDRMVVVPNGIDADAFRRTAGRREQVRAALNIDIADVVIGSVGRLEPQKRFDLLIEAFARLAATHPPLRLVIAGGGSLHETLARQAAALGVGAQCRLLGHREDVPDLLQAFDVFVQSSEYEGTSNAVLEAMALETPLVATDVGGTPELAVHGVHALIVPGRDVAALAAAIASVIRDPEPARARAAAARRRVETDLSFDARTRQLERIYLELAQTRRRGPASVAVGPQVHDA